MSSGVLYVGLIILNQIIWLDLLMKWAFLHSAPGALGNVYVIPKLIIIYI